MRLQPKGLGRLLASTIISITPISVKKRGNRRGPLEGPSIVVLVWATPCICGRSSSGEIRERNRKPEQASAQARPASFCRKTRFPPARPLPDGRGSDAKSRSINEVIRAPTVREGLLRHRNVVSRQKLARFRQRTELLRVYRNISEQQLREIVRVREELGVERFELFNEVRQCRSSATCPKSHGLACGAAPSYNYRYDAAPQGAARRRAVEPGPNLVCRRCQVSGL